MTPETNDSYGENISDVVYLTNAVYQRDSQAGVLSREHEEVDKGAGGDDARNWGCRLPSLNIPNFKVLFNPLSSRNNA
jgi:hypothetical protein